MTCEELNEYRKSIFLDKDEIKFIHEHGIDGFWAIVIKQMNLAPTPDELDPSIDYESNEYALNHLLNFPKIKATLAKRNFNIHIDIKSLKDIDNELLQIIHNVIQMIPQNNVIILRDTSLYQKNAERLTYSEIEKENVFLEKSDHLLELEYGYLLSLIFRNMLDRIVFKKWNSNSNRDEYLPFSKDKLIINIENKDSIEELKMIFESISKLVDRGILNKVILEIKVKNTELLRCFDQIFPDENNDKIVYTVNVEEIDRYDGIEFVGKNKDIVFHMNGVSFDSWDKFMYFEKLSNFVLSKIPSNASDMEKVIYISKFISNYLSYDYETVGNNPNFTGKELSFYDMVYKRKGVCRHIAWLTNYFLNKLGIQSTEIDIGSSDMKDLDSGIGHAVNMVYLDGIPYFIDNTGNLGRYKLFDSPFFLVSSEDFSKAHRKYANSILDYDCPHTIPASDVYAEECKVNEWSAVTEEELKYLQSIGQQNLVNYYTGGKINLDQSVENAHDDIYRFLNSVSGPHVIYDYCGSRKDHTETSITFTLFAFGYDGKELYDRLREILCQDRHCILEYSDYYKSPTMKFCNVDKMTLRELKNLLSTYSDIIANILEVRKEQKADIRRF